MRLTPRISLSLALGLSLLPPCVVRAQAPATQPAASAAASASPKLPIEQRTERIHLEDKDAVIDELRVGGQTKSIDVQPKNGMPAYQVSPSDGQRSWKVLGF